jgi:hypothetical protein
MQSAVLWLLPFASLGLRPYNAPNFSTPALGRIRGESGTFETHKQQTNIQHVNSDQVERT